MHYIKGKSQQGFTLIELIITVLVAGVLMAVVIPSFQHISTYTQLTSTANKVVGSLRVARSQALKTAGQTMLCDGSSNATGTLGSACDSNSAGAIYTLVYQGGNQVAKLIKAPLKLPGKVQLKTITALEFGVRGLAYKLGDSNPYSGTVATLCSNSISSQNRIEITMATGSNITTKMSDDGC